MAAFRKRIAGGRGETTIGPVSFTFDVVGHQLRYRRPLHGLVDSLVQERPGVFVGRTTYLGRPLGTFRMIRI